MAAALNSAVDAFAGGVLAGATFVIGYLIYLGVKAEP